MDILNVLVSLFGQGTTDSIISAIGLGYALLVAIANIVTMLLPSVSTNPVYNAVMKVLNFLSLNILKNKNADDK
jgi:hypothetical protein